MKTRNVVLFSTIVAATAAYVLYDKFGTPSGDLPRPTSLPPATKPLSDIKATLTPTLPSTQKTVTTAKQTIAPPTDYEITLPADLPANLRPWIQQVLEEAKQKILSGENFNQLWTHDNLRVRLIMSDKPFALNADGIYFHIGSNAIAVDGPDGAVGYILETIDKIATHYGRDIGYVDFGGTFNGQKAVDLLASALQS